MNKNVLKSIFPLLALVLWIAAIVLFVKTRGFYNTDDSVAYQAIQKAKRWQPACCIGAIISTALSFVVGGIISLFEEEREA